MTDVLTVDSVHPDAQLIARAAARLRDGGLVAFPTETVYGLGGHALDRVAVRRIFEAKGRPSSDPLIVHVASLAQLRDLAADVPDSARALAARFWPGPLTLVLPRSPLVPDEVTGGLDTVAIRVPAHPVARALLEAAGVPVAAPSANLFSRPSPTRAAHVLEDLDGRIDVVLDGGPTQVGVESTVLDLAHGLPTILRPGAITLEMLRELLPDVRLASTVKQVGEAMASPGLLEKHYSPRATLTLYQGAAAVKTMMRAAAEAAARGTRVGLLLASDDPGGPDGSPLADAEIAALSHCAVQHVGPSRNLARVASQLYAALRDLDALGLDAIYARDFPGDDGMALAIRDRLQRAAAGRIVRA